MLNNDNVIKTAGSGRVDPTFRIEITEVYVEHIDGSEDCNDISKEHKKSKLIFIRAVDAKRAIDELISQSYSNSSSLKLNGMPLYKVEVEVFLVCIGGRRKVLNVNPIIVLNKLDKEKSINNEEAPQRSGFSIGLQQICNEIMKDDNATKVNDAIKDTNVIKGGGFTLLTKVKVIVSHEGSRYVWNGALWYNTDTYLNPPIAIIRKLNNLKEAQEPGFSRVKKYFEPTIKKSSSSPRYVNHCWSCQSIIDSFSNSRCPKCNMYICKRCGSCMCKPNIATMDEW